MITQADRDQLAYEIEDTFIAAQVHAGALDYTPIAGAALRLLAQAREGREAALAALRSAHRFEDY